VIEVSRRSLFFCANSAFNWIQFPRSFSQTACHATDEIFRTAQHSNQGAVMSKEA